MAKVVTEKNIEIVRQIRNSKFNYKVRSIVDSFDEILSEIK